MISLDAAIWVAVIFNLLHWTYLYKETRLFRFSEQTFIALTVANGLVFAMININNLGTTPLIKGEIIKIIPIILGLTTWAIISIKYAWMSRYAISLMIGVGTGLAIVGTIKANILGQLTATMNLAKPTLNVITNINNFLIIIITISTFVYFFFISTTHIPRQLNNMREVIIRFARYSIMAAFGTSIGGDIFGRTSMMIARILFFAKDWLGL